MDEHKFLIQAEGGTTDNYERVCDCQQEGKELPIDGSRFFAALCRSTDCITAALVVLLTIFGVASAISSFSVFHQKTSKPQWFAVLSTIDSRYLKLSLYKNVSRESALSKTSTRKRFKALSLKVH